MSFFLSKNILIKIEGKKREDNLVAPAELNQLKLKADFASGTSVLAVLQCSRSQLEMIVHCD